MSWLRLTSVLVALSIASVALSIPPAAASHPSETRQYVVADGVVGTHVAPCVLDLGTDPGINSVCFPIPAGHGSVTVTINDTVNNVRGVPTFGFSQLIDAFGAAIPGTDVFFCGSTTHQFMPEDAASVEVAVEPHWAGVGETILPPVECADNSGTAGTITADFI